MSATGEGSDEPSSRGKRRAERTPLPSGFSTLRDLVTFILGLGIVGNEVFLQPQIETAAMTVGIAFLGLPVVFGTSERKK